MPFSTSHRQFCRITDSVSIERYFRQLNDIHDPIFKQKFESLKDNVKSEKLNKAETIEDVLDTGNYLTIGVLNHYKNIVFYSC